MAAYFGIWAKSFSYMLGMFRANICYGSVIGSENTAGSVCTVGSRPSGGPLTPHVKCALDDTRTKFVPYTIILKLVPKFKLLHQSEVTVAQETLLSAMTIEMSEAAGGKGAGGKRNSRASKTVFN